MTEFAETAALLIALEDGESEELDDYLYEHFLPSELRRFARACRALNWTAEEVAKRLEREERLAERAAETR